MKNDRKVIGIILFISVQAICYIAFLSFDFGNSHIDISNKLKFIMILICFCYVLFIKNTTDKDILNFMRLASLFTVVSDLNLLLLDHYFYGVVSFVIVQQLYGLRIDAADHKNIIMRSKAKVVRTLLIRLVWQIILTMVVCSVLYIAGVNLNALLFASMIYFISIVTNVIRSLKTLMIHRQISNLLFALGMVLFLLCDINVGLFNLVEFIVIPGDLQHFIVTYSSILMWMFYAPSQILITVSHRCFSSESTKI